jgi:hypothetical protein
MGTDPPSWSTPLTFRLGESRRSTDVVCRCGVRIAAGCPSIEAHPSSPRLQPFFADVPFCSLVCLRAFVRESIESLDGFPDRHHQEICSDLRELVLDLEEVWAALENAYPRDRAGS